MHPGNFSDDGEADAESVPRTGRAASYDDVRPGAWYYEEVTVAAATGTDNDLFIPKGETTRAQAAVVLIRTLQALGWQQAE